MPAWHLTIKLADVFRDETRPFEQRRDAIVERLRASGWLDWSLGAVPNLVDKLSKTADTDEFDAVWGRIYDHADIDRVWISTF